MNVLLVIKTRGAGRRPAVALRKAEPNVIVDMELVNQTFLYQCLHPGQVSMVVTGDGLPGPASISRDLRGRFKIL